MHTLKKKRLREMAFVSQNLSYICWSALVSCGDSASCPVNFSQKEWFLWPFKPRSRARQKDNNVRIPYCVMLSFLAKILHKCAHVGHTLLLALCTICYGNIKATYYNCMTSPSIVLPLSKNWKMTTFRCKRLIRVSETLEC